MQHADALYLFNEGRPRRPTACWCASGAEGTTFRVWRPMPRRFRSSAISMAGMAKSMRCALGDRASGPATIAEAPPGSLYRFEITNRHTGDKLIKGDPYARGFEHRPGSAAYVVPRLGPCLGRCRVAGGTAPPGTGSRPR